MKVADFPDSIIEQHNLKQKATPEGFVYVAMKKGMYGLPQSGRLAQELLETRLNSKGYRQSLHTPDLWTRE